MSIRRTGVRMVAVAWALVGATACTDTMGGSVTAATSGTTQLFMQRDTSSTAPSQAPDTASSPRRVDQDSVQSLTVTVVGIDYLAAGAADTSDTSAAWVHAGLSTSFDLNLMSLPADSSAAQLVAATNVAAGTYAAVRLRVTNPRIVFKGSVSFGAAGIVTGGTEYQVVIPSVAKTGLKAAASVSVQANGSTNVRLIFQSARTLGNIAVTGTGQVMMSPVLTAR